MQYMRSREIYGYLGYHHSETVTDATSEALLIPDTNNEASVSITPGGTAGNNVTLQYTVSHPDKIEANTAVWHDLESGPVNAPILVTIDKHPVAIRVISVGTATIEVYT